MSEELKRKLYNYEVNPSAEMWNKIAASLDEEINAEFPQALYDAESIPPPSTWNKIASALDQAEYPTKLYNLEVSPPANAWEKISNALDEEKILPSIAPRKRVVPFVRYAVAATVIGAVAFGSIKLLNQKSTTRSVASKPGKSQAVTPAIIQPNGQKDSSGQASTRVSNDLQQPEAVVIKTSVGPKRRSVQQAAYMTLRANGFSDVDNNTALAFQQASLTGEVPGNCAAISDADRYLSFMNPDGYLIRMSKKLADALGCYHIDGNSDEYKQCQEQIKKWRDKIAQSSASTSPDNFMDVLDIIKTVQDNDL